MSSKARKALSYYLALRYPVQIVEQAEGGYFVMVPDLPGCMSQGETIEEAIGAVQEARQTWLEEAYKSGMEIPLPEEERQYSGKFVVRVPRSLHGQLARAAESEGVSLNQYLVSVLSAGSPLRSINERLGKVESCVDKVEQGLAERPPWNYRLSFGGPLRDAGTTELRRQRTDLQMVS